MQKVVLICNVIRCRIGMVLTGGQGSYHRRWSTRFFPKQLLVLKLTQDNIFSFCLQALHVIWVEPITRITCETPSYFWRPVEIKLSKTKNSLYRAIYCTCILCSENNNQFITVYLFLCNFIKMYSYYTRWALSQTNQHRTKQKCLAPSISIYCSVQHINTQFFLGRELCASGHIINLHENDTVTRIVSKIGPVWLPETGIKGHEAVKDFSPTPMFWKNVWTLFARSKKWRKIRWRHRSAYYAEVYVESHCPEQV
jgi:hypothetical protein